MTLTPGLMLSHYRLVDKIGEGGMGVVWKAEDTKLGRDVAVKVLPENVSSNPERSARFRREARTLAALHHPNIASIFGFEEVDGETFLVMELVEGSDLFELLKRGSLPVADALEVARQIAMGLEEAHSHDIVHRDLKPGNVMCTGDDKVKILDFGLARVFGDQSASDSDLTMSPTLTADMTREGVVVGTAPYMSPEQARGKKVDKRTDIWAFGCILYESLTGCRPFPGGTVTDVLANVVKEEPDWSRLPSETPPLVRSVLRRCLAKDPERRLRDAGDARIEIEESLTGRGVSEQLATPAQKSDWGKLVWALAGLVAGVLGAAFFLSSELDQPDNLVTPGKTPARFAITLKENEYNIPIPDTSSVAVSADGSLLAYTASIKPGGGVGLQPSQGDVTSRGTQLVLRRINSFESQPIEGTLEASGPFFSPDGRWIGFLDYRDGMLKKVLLQGGIPVPLADTSLDFRGANWSDDGKIYYSTSNQGLLAVSENGGESELLTSIDRDHGEKTHRFPHALPGGRGLLFTHATSDIASYDGASVALLNLETGEISNLIQGGSNPRYSTTGHIVYARAGALEAVPFDIGSLQVTGTPRKILEGVITSDGYGAAHFSFSDTGTLVYVPGGPDQYHHELYLVDRSGEIERVDLPTRPYGNCRFSPDGKKLVISILGANAGLWVYEFERRTMTRLTTHWDNFAPVWSRDGSTLSFGSNRSGTNALWRMNADGSGEAELLIEAHFISYAGSWSPDGERISFSSLSSQTGSDIWIWAENEDPQTSPFLETPAQEFHPFFSPDGSRIAYVSDASGNSETYVQPYPPTGQKWQISAEGGEAPLWMPDGNEIRYWRGNKLMSVRLAADMRASPSPERVVIETPFSAILSWDIAPDGEKFLVVGRMRAGDVGSPVSFRGGRKDRSAAGVAELRVVVDWFEELKDIQ